MTNIHLLLGPEIGEKKQYIDTIIGQLTKTLGEEPEIHKIYPFETSVSDLVSLLRNGSLFSPHKVVILENAEALPKTNEANSLIDYLQKPAADTTLIMTTEKTALDQKKIDKEIPKEGRKIFWEMFESKKSGWISQFFRQRQREITQEAIDELLELITNNTEEMKEACDTLCFHYPENHKITADDVEKIIYHSKQETVFSLFDKLLNSDLDGALSVLEAMTLAHQAEPIPVLAGLSWQFQRFLKYRIILEQTKSSQQAASGSGIRAKRAQALHQKASDFYTIRDIQEILTQITVTDRNVREMGKSFHRGELQMFLYRVLKPAPVNRLT